MSEVGIETPRGSETASAQVLLLQIPSGAGLDSSLLILLSVRPVLCPFPSLPLPCL